MATQTAHFELEKPSQTDVVDVAVLNNNFDDIDVVMFANQERSKAAVSNAADAYDATKTYAVDALVIYENQLYKCTTAITTAEQWDSTKWKATTLAEEIGTGGGGGGNADLVHCTQAEYDALPASKLTDDKIYMITDVSQKEVEGEVYSTSERIVGKWIDGSDIYKKTQSGGINFAQADTWYDTNITDVDEVIEVKGSILRSGEQIELGAFNDTVIDIT